MADNQPIPKDPIQTRSMSVSIFVSMAILMGSVVLAGWDEFHGRRPYKQYQRGFIAAYQNYLEDLLPKQEANLAELIQRPEYQELEATRELANATKVEQEAPIIADLARIQLNVDALQAAVKAPNSLISSLYYKLETARSEDAKDDIRAEMKQTHEIKHEVITVTAMSGDEVTESETVEMNLQAMQDALAMLNDEKGGLESDRAVISGRVSIIDKQLAAYVDKNLQGPTPDAIVSLMEKAEAGLLGSEGKSVDDILQIHIPNVDWVDRCESCHAGAREPFVMSAEDVLATTDHGVSEDNVRVYTTHPNKELLKIHDPDDFGCSMCHGGNGRSVTSVHLAHGMNHHWLHPMHAPENTEAGCVQCHMDDFQLDHADTLNEGKWLFFSKGCWGCHKYDGFDSQFEAIEGLKNERQGLEDQRDRLEIAISIEKEQVNKAPLSMKVSGITTRLDELADLQGELTKERQRPGPDLRNAKAKIQRDWLLPWLLDPTAFRPTTKMPTFFENLEEDVRVDHATKIAAYIWQSARTDVALPNVSNGNADRGKDLFLSRGCIGCHTIEVDGETIGDGFAADLSRVGEKGNLAFLVKWIMEPDNGVMPSLRLTLEESTDIATYLMSRRSDRAYAASQDLADPKHFDEGKELVNHYGCMNCHDITGFKEDPVAGIKEAGRIGTELTVEGSKPKERLDFGRLEHAFEREHMFTHKHFFENKLRKPGIFGLGKEYKSHLEELKMPNFRLEEDEITALTTLLLGSVESEIPEHFKYQPDARQKAIQEGWWVIRKYNCVGCHQFEPGVEPTLWGLEAFSGTELEADGVKGTDRRPPSLVGQGFRSNPDWLATFLRNPSLHEGDEVHRNGVRPYLAARMPTFRFSEREIQILVRFFGATDSQPDPYIEQEVEPLNDAELVGMREFFKLVQCYKCHETADGRSGITAPDLTVAPEKIKPDWMIRWFTSPKVMMPGTGMPAAFVPVHEIVLGNGTTYKGRGFKVAKDGNAQITTAAGVQKFPATQIRSERMLRWVADTAPPELESLPGEPDHRDLMMRYLLKHFDAAEVQRTTPK